MHRLTFSKSLAELISSYDPEKYSVKKFNFILGKKLNIGEFSQSGAYAIVSHKGDYVLRISLIKEQAEIYCCDPSRYLAEVWLA